MGDIKKKKKKYSRPRQLFDRERIDAEDKLLKKYGLKNKKEIWKAKSKVSKIRRQAKNLIPEPDEKKQIFFEKLKRMGFRVNDISEVLALTEEDYLNRRLQTFVFNKRLANTPNQSRQLIVHKNILVNGKIVNVPSFIVTKDLEEKISLKERKMKNEKINQGEENGKE